MKPSEYKISYSVESYDKNIAENWRNVTNAKKHIVYKQ